MYSYARIFVCRGLAALRHKPAAANARWLLELPDLVSGHSRSESVGTLGDCPMGHALGIGLLEGVRVCAAFAHVRAEAQTAQLYRERFHINRRGVRLL